MRNLDKENPLIAHPQSLVLVGALLAFLLGGMCSILASEATPTIGLLGNPLAIFCLCVSAAAVICCLVPKIFRWNWRAQYFGFSTLLLASVSLLGIIPWLCLVLYSALSPMTRFFIFCAYIAINFWWCRRFVLFYGRIFSEKILRDFVYLEEIDAVYYSQKNDNCLMEKRFRFRQFPSAAAVLIPFVSAFLLVPFSHTINVLVGLPFALSFLTVGSLPITLMILGLTTRGLLIFYFYPWKIKKQTGKIVYVDLLTKTAMPRKQ